MRINRSILGLLVAGLCIVIFWILIASGFFSARRPARLPSEHSAAVGLRLEPLPQPAREAPSEELKTSGAVLGSMGNDRGIGVIVGKVFLADGSISSHAAITLRSVQRPEARTKSLSEPAPRSLESDDMGAFEIRSLPWGCYTLLAESGDNSETETVYLASDCPVAQILIVLRSGGRLPIQGVVVDESDAPVVGAEVLPLTHDGAEISRESRSIYRTRTNALGEFTLDPLAVGKWRLYVTASGYAPLSTEPVEAGTTNTKFTLGHGGFAFGSVTGLEPDGEMAGIRISARLEDAVGTCRTVKTEKNGRFEFADLEPGVYTFAPSDDHIIMMGTYHPTRVDIGAKTNVGVLRIGAGGAIRGRVYDADTFVGLSDVKVSVVPKSPNAPKRWALPVLTSTDGSYELKGLAKCEYQLSLSGVAGYPEAYNLSVMPTVTGAPGNTIDGVDIPLRRGTQISGTVVDRTGLPIAHASVRGAAGPNAGHSNSYTSEDGAFTLGGFQPGDSIQIYAKWLDVRTIPQGPFVLPQDGLKGLRIVMDGSGTGSISGKVLRSDLRAYGYAAVSALPRNESLYMAADPLPSVFARSDGSFTLVGLVPGDYDLRLGPASSIGILQAVVPAGSVHIDAGQRRTGLVLIYDDRAPKISGRVTDPFGFPVFFAEITATGTVGPARTAFSDRSGHYEILDVTPGANEVWVSTQQYPLAILPDVVSGSSNVDFVLQSRLTIEGHVTDAQTQKPVSEFYIGKAGADEWRIFNDPEGKFSMEVAPGNILLEIQSNNYAKAQFQATGSRNADERAELTIALRPKP